MWSKLKSFFEFASKSGLYLPNAYDPNTKKASTTLFSFYLGILVAITSVIAFHFFPNDLVGPTSFSLLFFGMTFVFYRMRSIDKFKLDLDDKSIELEDVETPNNKKENE